MLRRGILHALLVLSISVLANALFAQASIKPLREIRLPTPSSRGSYARFPIPGLSARDHFSMHVAPDQSILVFDSDTSGKWPLVRVKQWWTDHPVSEVLTIPGWSDADAKYMDGIHVDVQVSPDGRYAVTFGEAVWKDKTSFLLHVPHGYVGRDPDTIISVIDLQRWALLKTIHTSSIGKFYVRDARVLSNGWIGLDNSTDEPPSNHGVYRYVNRLLSLPELAPGPECSVQRFSHIWRPAPASLMESVRTQNDAACQDVLRSTGISSSAELDAQIQKASDVEPTTMKLLDVRWREYLHQGSRSSGSDEEKIWDADGESDQFFRHWGEYPLDDLYMQNPPFESSLRLWYGLYSTQNHGLYELARYDGKGEKQAGRIADHLLCGDASVGNPKSACGCRVVDLSEEGHALLSYCRQQHGDFTGYVQRQWLSVFRPDDLSAVELIELPKGGEVFQTLGSGDGHTYVLTLEFGETLRIYPVPDHLRPN